MSKKAKQYSATEKTKIVIEAIMVPKNWTAKNAK